MTAVRRLGTAERGKHADVSSTKPSAIGSSAGRPIPKRPDFSAWETEKSGRFSISGELRHYHSTEEGKRQERRNGKIEVVSERREQSAALFWMVGNGAADR